MPTEETKIAVVETELKNVTKSVDNLATKIEGLTEKIDNHYVKKEDFNPVKESVDKLRLWQAKVFGIAIGVNLCLDLVAWLIFKK